MFYEPEFVEADLILEMADLNEYNKLTHDIEVPKFIFDDYVEGGLVYIHFVEDEENIICEYRMIHEYSYGIVMTCVCYYD
jgi:hypothetical protein